MHRRRKEREGTVRQRGHKCSKKRRYICLTTTYPVMLNQEVLSTMGHTNDTVTYLSEGKRTDGTRHDIRQWDKRVSPSTELTLKGRQMDGESGNRGN